MITSLFSLLMMAADVAASGICSISHSFSGHPIQNLLKIRE